MASTPGGSGGPAATGRRGYPGSPPPSISTGTSTDSAATPAGRQAGQTMASLRRAGPLAFAGVAANAANVIVTVTIAHLLNARDYGSLGQLLVLFLVLSMPGSALLVAVVRRVTAWSMAGQADRIKPWASSVRRWGLLGLALLALLAWLCR